MALDSLNGGVQVSPFMMSALLERQNAGRQPIGTVQIPNLGAEYNAGADESNVVAQQKMRTTQDQMALHQQQTIQLGQNLLAKGGLRSPQFQAFAQQNPGTAKALVMKAQSDQINGVLQRSKLMTALYQNAGGDLKTAQNLAPKFGIDPKNLPPTQDAFYAETQVALKHLPTITNAAAMMAEGQRQNAMGSEASGTALMNQGKQLMQATVMAARGRANASNARANLSNTTAPGVPALQQSEVNKNNASAQRSVAQGNEANVRAANGGSVKPPVPFKPSTAQVNQALAVINNINDKIPTAQANAIAVKAASDAGQGMTMKDNWGQRLLVAVHKNLKDYHSGGFFGGASFTPPLNPNYPKPTQAELDYVKAHPESVASFEKHFGIKPPS